MNIQMTDCTKFLGVYIDHKLTWQTHITHLLDTLHTNKQMLSLGKHLLDTTCLRNIYYGHIHLHIIYGISVCGSMATQSMINEIFKIQKQCICMMRPTSQQQETSTMFQDLYITTIQDMIHIAMCKLGHNISHKHFPSPIIHLFDKFRGQKIHQYPMWSKHIPNIQCYQSEQYRKSFLCRSISDFNKLPTHLRNTSKTTSFLNQLRRYTLQV